MPTEIKQMREFVKRTVKRAQQKSTMDITKASVIVQDTLITDS